MHLAVAMMTAASSLGLIYRQRHGLGWESIGLLVIDGGALAMQIL